MSAEEAAAFIPAGSNVGMSGFTGSGYPKAVPAALVDRITEAKACGDRFAVSIWTGASTAPEFDGTLAEVEGMHDIDYGTALPPNRKPLQITDPADRIGVPYFTVAPEKIIAVVETDAPDRNNPFKPLDADSKQIAGHVIDFLSHEVKKGRLPENLLPLQSGVGNIANAVMSGLGEGPFRNLTAYTEVIQDGMLELLKSGTLKMVSATAFSLSVEGMAELNANIEDYRKRIILRPQEISNHPEVIRRLGCIAMNGMLEADIYGNVNSTHLMGSSIVNGIGGSGDFARNAYIAMSLSPSTAKGGLISCIVPMVSHVDHTEHDTHVVAAVGSYGKPR